MGSNYLCLQNCLHCRLWIAPWKVRHQWLSYGGNSFFSQLLCHDAFVQCNVHPFKGWLLLWINYWTVVCWYWECFAPFAPFYVKERTDSDFPLSIFQQLINAQAQIRIIWCSYSCDHNLRQSIEWFIVDQSFSPSYNFASPAPLPLPPLPSVTSNGDTWKTEKKTTFWRERGGGGGRGAKLDDGKKALFSINHPILSGLRISF